MKARRLVLYQTPEKCVKMLVRIKRRPKVSCLTDLRPVTYVTDVDSCGLLCAAYGSGLRKLLSRFVFEDGLRSS